AYSCGLRSDATVDCWRGDWRGAAGGFIDPPGGRFSAISSASRHSCGLRPDATIACWGVKQYGQTDPPAPANKTLAHGPTKNN
ncbi:MAG: hypothetical protein OXP08_06380, partial [bacterium]|nr:hypothetical protein [bacterium]